MSIPSSISKTGKTEPFDLQVSRRQIPYHVPLFKFGYNPDVNGVEETVWTHGGNYPWPTSAAVAYVNSTSTADADGGTGANTVLVAGVDADYKYIEEVVTMNGQAQVVTTNLFLRIFRAYVTLSGTGGTAAGTIYIAYGSGLDGGFIPTGTITADLSEGAQTQIAAYTVPFGKTLYLDDINFTAGLSQASKTATVRFDARFPGTNTWRTLFINVLQSNQLIAKFEFPQIFPAGTDMECRVVTNTTNNAIGASFQGVLIDNDAENVAEPQAESNV